LSSGRPGQPENRATKNGKGQMHNQKENRIKMLSYGMIGRLPKKDQSRQNRLKILKGRAKKQSLNQKQR